jgi:hypothetical protein
MTSARESASAERMATLRAVRSKSTGLRSRRLGDIGEFLAERILEASHFTNITNLNRRSCNFPYADYYAERNGSKYVISVKIRNKYEFAVGKARRLNSRYKLGSNCYHLAPNAEREFGAKAAWLTISLDECTYSAFFGLLSALNGSTGISMTAKATSTYECLAENERHGLDYPDLKNEYPLR